jgi:hypothetical protein
MQSAVEQLLRVPKGWQISEVVPSAMGDIVNVTGLAGTGAVAPIVVVAFTIPNGMQALVDRLACRMIDAGGDDQIFFKLRHNGLYVRPFEKVSATVFTYTKELTVGQTFLPGLLEIVAQNDNVADLRVQAYFFGWLLRRIGGE